MGARSRFHLAGLRPKEGNWVCFSISRAATWPQTWQATQLTKLLLYGSDGGCVGRWSGTVVWYGVGQD